MLYSHDWLRTFVPHDLPASEAAALIGRHVATIDHLQPLRADLAPIVIARVVEAGRHPNSDHLWVTKVDDGSGTLLDVVCGAPNVVAGTLYPFARVGTVMPTGNKGGILIEKRKIRGEWSTGMLCSAKELGLGEDHDGIMPLDLDVPTGTPLLQALPIGDVQLEVDVLPNRPDLFCHLGMARELSAISGHARRSLHEVIAAETGHVALALPAPVSGPSGGLTVQLKDHDGCPRYMAVVIRGVRVGPSPSWLVQRLDAVGSRSISNVVDATNYMLHSAGQPMHAFDLARLAQQTIVVRAAAAGEKLVTLDGLERTLAEGMTVIADAERPVAVAGVMGGRDSEVTEATTDIVLEVAYFDPRRTRRTRKALGLNTDASHRFERGVDAWGTAEALEAAAQLIVAVAGGQVDGAPIDLGAPPARTAAVALDVARAQRLLGDSVPSAEMQRLLGTIGCDVSAAGAETLMVTPPVWRRDLLRDADLVEELARLRGFDQLPDTLRAFRPGAVPDHPLHVVTRRLRQLLIGEGLLEVRPMPFVRGTDESHVRVTNPLAEDEPHLRRTISETLARRAEHNLSRMEGNVRLFEVGAVFAPTGDTLPRESLHAGVLLMGQSRPPHFTELNPPAYDVWDVRALGERMAREVHGAGVEAVAGEGAWLWLLQLNGAEVGRVFRVELDKPVWAADAFGIELWLGAMENGDVAPPGTHAPQSSASDAPARAHRQYMALPVFPAAEFDLALLLPDGMPAADVDRCIRATAGSLLEDLRVFDEYRGKGLPEGHRSVAFRLTFRDATRTLRDKEVEGRRAKILQTLEKELGIRPRST